VASVSGDHVSIEIPDHRRSAQPARQPVPERPEDRRVLPPGSRRGSARGDPLRLAEQVALRKRLLAARRTDHGTGIEVPLPHHRGPVPYLDPVDQVFAGSELKPPPGHERRLSLKRVISGQIKPGTGRPASLILLPPHGSLRSVKRSFQT